jgi:hypothetical protein
VLLGLVCLHSAEGEAAAAQLWKQPICVNGSNMQLLPHSIGMSVALKAHAFVTRNSTIF